MSGEDVLILSRVALPAAFLLAAASQRADRRLEVLERVERLVHAREPEVGDLVELTERADRADRAERTGNG